MPIIPEYLYDINHPDKPIGSIPRTPLTTPKPCPPVTLADGTYEVTTYSAGNIFLENNIFLVTYNYILNNLGRDKKIFVKSQN